MAPQLSCPECGAPLHFLSPIPGRNMVGCPKCGASFRVGGSEGEGALPRSKSTPTPPAPVRRVPEDGHGAGSGKQDPAEDEPRPKKKPRKKIAKKNSIGLVLGIGGGVLVLLLAGSIVWWTLQGKGGQQPSAGGATSEHAPGGPVGPFAGHQGPVLQASFTANGQRILSCSADNTVRLWDASTGQQLQVLEGLACMCLAVSPDGQSAVVGTSKGELKLWDLNTWRELRPFPGHQLKGNPSIVTAATFSPDGNRVLSSGLDYSLRLWDTKTGQEVRHYDRYDVVGTPWCVAFFPNGQRFMGGYSQGSVCVYGPESEKELIRFLPPGLGKANGLAVAPDNVRFVAAGDGGAVVVIEMQTYQSLVVFTKHSAPVRSIAISPDGQWVLSGGDDKTVRLWELNTGNEVRAFEGHTQAVLSVAFSPDGKRAVSAGRDTVLRVWDLPAAPSPGANPPAAGPGGYSPAFQEMAKRLEGRWSMQTPEVDTVTHDYREDGTFAMTVNRGGKPMTITGIWKVVVVGKDSVKIQRQGSAPPNEYFEPNDTLNIQFEGDQALFAYKNTAMVGVRQR